MNRIIAMMGLSLAALALPGCDRQDRSPTRPQEEYGKGSARVALPSLPSGYLADSGQAAWFALSITGPGMAPILKTWPLSPDHAEPVLVEGIPAGMRSFQGRLIRIDPAGHDTLVTHEGGDSAYIQGGKVAEVRLFLKAAGSGSAHVCVEVEGWPADPTCIAPPPAPNVAGCYRFQVTKPGQSLHPDTLFQGKLSLFQEGRSLQATIDWGGGHADTAMGLVDPDGTIFFEPMPGAPFSLKGHPDSAGFWGSFDDASGIAGAVRADAVPCEAAIPGDTILVDAKVNRACYSVSQLDVEGKTLNGSLAVEARDGSSEADVYARFKGFDLLAGRTYYLWADSAGSKFGFRLAVPAKVFPFRPVEEAAYDVSVSGTGVLAGVVMESKPASGLLGSLKGQRRACSDADFPR